MLPKTTNLILRYTYEFMPKGIITQLIVAMHQKINNQKYVWRTGVILNQNQTKAEVIEFYDKREIKIRVTGKYKRDLMTNITYELDKIHDSYKHLKYQKLIPCNCKDCKHSQEPHFYRYENLKKRIANKKYDVECEKSYEMVSVLGLIDDVIDINQFISQDNHKSINFEGNINNLLFLSSKEGNISGDIMSNINQHHSGSGDNIARDKNTTNIYNSQDLTQAAAEIQTLLEQLEKSYPADTTTGKMTLATKAIAQIENNPTLTSRILSALATGGVKAFEQILNHPAASFVIGALEDWEKTKSKNS